MLQTHPHLRPCMRFLFVRPEFCPSGDLSTPKIRLSSDSASRRTPLPLTKSSRYRATSGLSPYRTCAHRAHSKRRGLVRVSAWCLLAPKDLACHVCREPHITRGERCSLFTYGSQNKQGKRIVTRALSQSLCKILFYNRTTLMII